MLVPAVALAAIPQRGQVPYHLLLKTEALSPHAREANLIQDKRHAYEFFLLVKPGAPKPLNLKTFNWRHANVLVLYAGLVQRDAKLKIEGIKKRGKTIEVAVYHHNGITTQTYYPIVLLTIPRQPPNTKVDVTWDDKITLFPPRRR